MCEITSVDIFITILYVKNFNLVSSKSPLILFKLYSAISLFMSVLYNRNVTLQKQTHVIVASLPHMLKRSLPCKLRDFYWISRS